MEKTVLYPVPYPGKTVTHSQGRRPYGAEPLGMRNLPGYRIVYVPKDFVRYEIIIL